MKNKWYEHVRGITPQDSAGKKALSRLPENPFSELKPGNLEFRFIQGQGWCLFPYQLPAEQFPEDHVNLIVLPSSERILDMQDRIKFEHKGQTYTLFKGPYKGEGK